MSAAMDRVAFSLPPSCSTGAEITAPLKNRVLIDWFAFTVFSMNIDDVLYALEMPYNVFTEMERGGLGYRKCSAFGGIRVYYDGANASMGIHVEMSGSGCREFEAYHDGKDPWPRLFHHIAVCGSWDNSPELGTHAKELSGDHKRTMVYEEGKLRYRVTRLDLAIDNIDGKLSLKKIWKGIENGETRSRFKKGRRYEGFVLGSKAEPFRRDGNTIYLGSSASRLQFRIYDKAAEQGTTDGRHWVRFELQLRDARAEAALHLIDQGRTVGEVATGVINNYLSFINHDDSNVSRCSPQGWWSEWLDASSKLRLTLEKKVRTVIDTLRHLKFQYAPAFAVIFEYFGATRAKEIIETIVDEGKERMDVKHFKQLAVTRALAPYPA